MVLLCVPLARYKPQVFFSVSFFHADSKKENDGCVRLARGVKKPMGANREYGGGGKGKGNNRFGGAREPILFAVKAIVHEGRAAAFVEGRRVGAREGRSRPGCGRGKTK